ncbi:hypothetical protein [Tatumella punctata]|uniref:Uncharacterized protein n=1 Tax=Tatumella punctata TaxID=399969 RepID=A0ABW1VSX3_9GAMM
MYKFILYPLNMFIVILLGIVFTSLDLSYFYNQPSIGDIFFCISILFFSVFFYILTFGWGKFSITEDSSLKKIITPLLTISVTGFFLEMALYGIPLLVAGGRDDYKTLPVLHVIFYSMLITASLLSSLYGKKKDVFICFGFILLMSLLFFTRQMLMVAFMMFMISYIYKGRGSKKYISLV